MVGHYVKSNRQAAPGEEIVSMRCGETVAALVQPQAPDAQGQARTLAARIRIRSSRAAQGSRDGDRVRDLIEEGRR